MQNKQHWKPPKKTWMFTWNDELNKKLTERNMNIRYIYKLKTHNTLNIRNVQQKLKTNLKVSERLFEYIREIIRT
jgi:hypothetical protein